MQLFSRSVANSFTLAGRHDLAYCVMTVNDWFDTMDSRIGHHRYNKMKSGLGKYWENQHSSLLKMLELTSGMVVGPTKTMKGPRKEMVAFQKGIICSIHAVLDLWEDLRNEGFNYLLTHKVKMSSSK